MMEGSEIVTVAQMRAIESAAIGSGVTSGLNLMTRAGRAVAGQIRLRWPKPGRATVLCGPGANGGDGYVVAQALSQAGWSVRVLGMPLRAGSDAAAARARWPGPVLPLEAAQLDRPDLYVDAMLGTGLTRPPDGPRRPRRDRRPPPVQRRGRICGHPTPACAAMRPAHRRPCAGGPQYRTASTLRSTVPSRPHETRPAQYRR